MDDARKVTIRISHSSARYVQVDTPREERLKAARCEADISLSELPVVLFLLNRDPDPEIRAAALDALKRFPEKALLTVCSSPDTHPRVLGLLARLHFQNPAAALAIARNPSCDESIRSFLAERGAIHAGEDAEPRCVEDAEGVSPEADEASGSDAAEVGEENLDEDEEEFKSKYQLTQEMGISEKIKMAITGDKEWRMLLIKDTNKLVSGAVIKNPRLTEAEVLMIAKSALNNDDILREICTNKEWIKNYQIRKALVENNKTPLHQALRFLTSLTEKDLAALAKSKNISSIIATQARRSLLNKKKEK
jgi:hypothetical protein